MHVCRFSLRYSHPSGGTPENRPNTFRAELLSAHDIIYISRPAPRASRITNSHELREMGSTSETAVSRRYFTCPSKRNARDRIRPVVVAVKSVARADAITTDPRRLIATSRPARGPDPSMRKIGVRAHEWAPAVNKVAAR